MAPEQAQGTAADRRSDIWAFGVVLYEMLSGKQAFSGETVADTLTAVLKFEPDWEKLPAGTLVLSKLPRRCLTKDRHQRLQAIGEGRITIDEALSGQHPTHQPAQNLATAKRTSHLQSLSSRHDSTA